MHSISKSTHRKPGNLFVIARVLAAVTTKRPHRSGVSEMHRSSTYLTQEDAPRSDTRALQGEGGTSTRPGRTKAMVIICSSSTHPEAVAHSHGVHPRTGLQTVLRTLAELFLDEGKKKDHSPVRVYIEAPAVALPSAAPKPTSRTARRVNAAVTGVATGAMGAQGALYSEARCRCEQWKST